MMERRSLLRGAALLVALPRLAAAQNADTLGGLWGGERDFGPALRGTLTIERRADGWEGRIGGRRAHGAAGDSVRLTFDSSGSFRGALAPDRGSIRGYWIQPPLRSGPQPFASPLVLPKRGASRWVASVVPLDDRVALYLDVRRGSEGNLVARLRNPDGTVGDAVFRARWDADTLRLDDANDSTRTLAAIASARRGRLLLEITGLGDFVLTRRDRAHAPGFFARLDTAWRYRRPVTRGDGWQTATPAAVGLDSLRLDSLARRIVAVDAGLGGQPLVHSVLVARHGKLAFEEYFYGFGVDTPHDLRSGSKTFASMLVGAAMRRGAPLGPETPVYASFPEYRPIANDDPRKARMTLAHLMTMTSGLACDENDGDSPGGEGRMQSQTTQPDWYEFTLDLPMAHAPGDTAIYCSAGVNLIGGVVRNAAHVWLPALFDDAFARPLAMSRWYFDLMPTGEAYLGGGVHMRPRDLLKIGQLYLDHGRWRGSRLVDSAWVAASTRPHPEINAQNGDGYDWHTSTIIAGDRRIAEYEANGNGGQFLIVLPELDMVVVFTAGNYGNYGVWRRFRDEWLARYLIPAR